MSVIEAYVDEIVVIPEAIKNMTKEERRAEIARLERIAEEEKRKSLEIHNLALHRTIVVAPDREPLIVW